MDEFLQTVIIVSPDPEELEEVLNYKLKKLGSKVKSVHLINSGLGEYAANITFEGFGSSDGNPNTILQQILFVKDELDYITRQLKMLDSNSQED